MVWRNIKLISRCNFQTLCTILQFSLIQCISNPLHRNGDVWLIRQHRRMSHVVKKKSRDHKNLSSETSFIISVPSSSLPWWVMSLRSGQSDNPEKMVQGQRDSPEPFFFVSSGAECIWAKRGWAKGNESFENKHKVFLMLKSLKNLPRFGAQELRDLVLQ